MNLVYVNSRKILLPMNFPQSIVGVNNHLEYFIKGIGYKKTLAYTIIDAKLPEKHDMLSWVEICEIHRIYGEQVALYYAETKTAGIIARQTLRAYYHFYTLISNEGIRLNKNDYNFFEMLKPIYLLSCFGHTIFDAVTFDKKMSKLDSEYDCDNATYKGKNITMMEYLETKYGLKAVNMVNSISK